MTGLGERTACTLLSQTIGTGLVSFTGRVAPVRLAYPLDALKFRLSESYPEGAARED